MSETLNEVGDLAWLHETGRCGGCGEHPSDCGCDGWCGCAVEHGIPEDGCE